MADHENLRDTLHLARGCVHKGEAPQAFGHLKTVQFEIEDLPGTSFWAEYQLVYAGALAGMNDRAAEAAFEDALDRCARLSEPNPVLEMTAHEDYARYLAGIRQPAFGRSRQHYREAERIAENLGREECSAHLQMCVIGLDLRESKSPHLRAFQRLQEAAKDGYTEVQQLQAWIDYKQEIEGFGPQLVETRKGAEPSTDYFRGLLTHIRRARK